MEIKGRLVEDFEHAERPGDFFFTPPNDADGGCRRLSFLCPCGCGTLSGIRVRDDGGTSGGAWQWNLDEDLPTTHPSIRIDDRDGEHWHGYLTDGVFKSV